MFVEAVFESSFGFTYVLYVMYLCIFCIFLNAKLEAVTAVVKRDEVFLIDKTVSFSSEEKTVPGRNRRNGSLASVRLNSTIAISTPSRRGDPASF